MERCISARELAKWDVPDWGGEGAIGLLLAWVVSFAVVVIAEIDCRCASADVVGGKPTEVT
jgi:hypothetical protein